MTLLRSFSIPHPAIDTEGIMRASRWRNVQATHDESAIKSATAPATLPATAPATTARQPKRRLAPPPQITPNAPPITTTANNEIAAKTAMMLACSATVTKRGHSSGHCSGHKIGNNPGNNFGNVSDNLTIHHAPPTPLHGPHSLQGAGDEVGNNSGNMCKASLSRKAYNRRAASSWRRHTSSTSSTAHCVIQRQTHWKRVHQSMRIARVSDANVGAGE